MFKLSVLVVAVSAGTLREDLYYRLIVVTITTPALRAALSLAPRAGERAVDHGSLGDGAQDTRDLEWPGNIREFQNVIERAIVLATGPVLGPQDLPDLRPIGNRRNAAPRLPGEPAKRSLSPRDRWEDALQENGGDCKQTAAVLKWSLPTVYRKVKKYQLSHLLKRPRD